ncbi:MAG: gamma carbonic anhydrase family protein, partial [Candidatus Methylomirabilis sp.]|nr:gamma carbonic anhydrase family protein [Deltaproteobacteria bacterium]
MIRPFHGKLPAIDATAFLWPDAEVIGDVEIGAESSLWPRVVVRGDVNYIRIGARTNLQDFTMVHV